MASNNTRYGLHVTAQPVVQNPGFSHAVFAWATALHHTVTLVCEMKIQFLQNQPEQLQLHEVAGVGQGAHCMDSSKSSKGSSKSSAMMGEPGMTLAGATGA